MKCVFLCAALSFCSYSHYFFSGKTTFIMWFIEDPHLYPLMRAAASGSTPSDVLLHLSFRLSGVRTYFHQLLSLVKMNIYWGFLGNKSSIRLLLLRHSVALQSVLVYIERGVVHIRPWLRLACFDIWLCYTVVNSTNGTIYEAGCVKSFSCSTALLYIRCATQ